jgi:hypothetical protein
MVSNIISAMEIEAMEYRSGPRLTSRIAETSVSPGSPGSSNGKTNWPGSILPFLGQQNAIIGQKTIAVQRPRSAGEGA